MTTRTNEVAVTLTGKDRLSPVLQNARKNMGRMQSSVVSMTSSMGAMSTATSGILGPMGSLVGTMGVLGLAVTGVGLGLSLGINKLKAWRAEQKKTSEASEQFRNRLMLSGFSADRATSAVDELRGSLGRLAFQALPGLNFEMQGFIANMDLATRTRFGDLVKNLTDMGIGGAAAAIAVGEAFQGNFTQINKLLPQTITSSEEFGTAMSVLETRAVDLETGVLKSLRNLAAGSKTSTQEQITALINVDNTFREHGGAVAGILAQLTEDERQQVRDAVQAWAKESEQQGVYVGLYGDKVTRVLGHIQRSITGEETHTTAVKAEHEARIKEIEKVAPALARAVRQAGREYAKDEFSLAVLRNVAEIEFGRIKAEQTGWVDSLETETQRAEGFLARLQTALSQARAAAAGVAAAAGRVSSGNLAVPRPVPRPFQHGVVAMRPTDARIGEVPEAIIPLSQLDRVLGVRRGGATQTPLVLMIGDQVFKRLVIESLNDEVTLVEPSLGLG